jgi:hypothetical protein
LSAIAPSRHWKCQCCAAPRLGVAGRGMATVAVGSQLRLPVGLPRSHANPPECSCPAEAVGRPQERLGP